MAVDTGKCAEAKLALRQALAAYGGNTKEQAVIAAIENLRLLNPNPAPTRNGKLLDNEWLLISAPNFPGGDRLTNGKFAYTLGRLAFNMFQPTNLKVVIDRVLQPVFLVGNGEQRSAVTILLSNLQQQMNLFLNCLGLFATKVFVIPLVIRCYKSDLPEVF